MQGQVTLGRGIAAVGIALGMIAIWTDFGPTSYWSFDGTLGGLLLILAVLAVLAIAAAFATGNREYDIAYGAIGGVGFGLYLFYPALFAVDQWDQLDIGSWLGLCSALTFIGASIATWPTDRPVRKPSAVGAVVALAGLALMIVGLFPSFVDDGGSYWSVEGYGHSYGIMLIILVVLEGLAIASAWSMASGMDNAVLLGGVALGAGIAFPVQAAFNHFGELGTGAWLTAIGGIVVGLGVLVMRRMAVEGAPAHVPPPATAPPAA